MPWAGELGPARGAGAGLVRGAGWGGPSLRSLRGRQDELRRVAFPPRCCLSAFVSVRGSVLSVFTVKVSCSGIPTAVERQVFFSGQLASGRFTFGLGHWGGYPAGNACWFPQLREGTEVAGGK